MILYQKELELNNDIIPEIEQEIIDTYKEAAGKRAINLLKLELTVEELFLDFMDSYGTKTPCKVTVDKSHGKIHITYEQKAAQANPLENLIYTDTAANLLTNLDVIPKYSYNSRTGVNSVHYTPDIKDRKNGTLTNILIAVVAAVLCFFLMKLLPEATQTEIIEAAISPIFSKLMAVMSTVATPLVFFAILNGIVEIGDISSLGKVGKKFLSEMMLTYAVAGLAFTVPEVIIYGIDKTSGVSDTSFVKEIIQLVLDIIPDNLLMPFTIDNDLQVVTVAILIGSAIIIMGDKAEPIKGALTVISDVVNQMMMIVLKILPLIVFTGILNIMSSNTEGLSKLWIVFAVFILASIIIEGYMIVRVKLSFKGISIRNLFHKQWPTALINLATSSQVSAYPENINCCRKGFGIQGKFVDFGLPLGIVMYMPNGAVFFGVTVWSLADLAGMPIGITQLIIIFVMSTVIAIAAPPIPGSALTVLPMMMSICAIPNAYFPIAVLLGTIIGYFLPLLNGYCLQLHMLIVAKQLDMVNEKLLYKEAKK